MFLVLLGGRDRSFIGGRPTAEPADVGIGAGLGYGVADAGALDLAAQLRSILSSAGIGGG